MSYPGPMKQYDKAIADYNESIRLDPDRPVQVYEDRALAHEKKGNVDQAKSDRETAKRFRSSDG